MEPIKINAHNLSADVLDEHIPNINKENIKNTNTNVNDIIYSRINNSNIHPETKKRLFNNNVQYVIADKNVAYNIRKVTVNSQAGFSYGFRNKDSMFIVAHGNNLGNISIGKYSLSTEQLGEVLTKNNLIPNDIKNIYTLSCYGGLQNKVDLGNDITLQSSHTSKQQIRALNPINSDISAIITPDGELLDDVKSSLISDENFTDVFNISDLDKYVENYAKQQGYLTSEEASKIYKTYDLNYYTSQGIDINNLSETERKNFELQRKNFIIQRQNKIKEYESILETATDKQQITNKIKQEKQLIEKLQKNEFKRDLSKEKEIIQNRKNNIDATKNVNTNKAKHKKQYKIKKRPKIKQTSANHDIKNTKQYKVFKKLKSVNDVKNETIEQVTKNNNNQLKNMLEESAKEAVEKQTKKAGKMSTKSLSGGGKLAIGVAIAGLIIGSAISSKNSNKPKKKTHQLSRTTNSEEIDNSYAMQMAQDISSYRYGKHMTGFVNH